MKMRKTTIPSLLACALLCCLPAAHAQDVFIPDIDKWEDWSIDVREVIRDVDYALLDGSFFADGELPGRDMSAIKHPFVSESMELFKDLTDDEKSRVIFIHFNHSNPLLIDDSEERSLVEKQGFRVAYEGMRLEL